MSVPTDNNISIQEDDKTWKYKDRETEIEKMWYLKTSTVPVIVRAIGMFEKEINTFTK